MPKLDTRGRVTLPVAVRQRLGLKDGSLVRFVQTEHGWVLQGAADQAGGQAPGAPGHDPR